MAGMEGEEEAVVVVFVPVAEEGTVKHGVCFCAGTLASRGAQISPRWRNLEYFY